METTEGVHELVVGAYPHPFVVSGWDKAVFMVRVATNMVSAVFRKCPLLDFVFSSHDSFLAVVQARLSLGLLALTSLLLKIGEDFLEG